MKIFIDTEFIEGFHKPILGKRRHFIDLISIGMVAEDGSTYYAISREYDYNKADDWVKENVILPLYIETVHGDNRNHFDVHNFHKHYGKSNKQIARDIVMFCYDNDSKGWAGHEAEFLDRAQKFGWNKPYPEFYAYYADYDWVVFCSLFGRMIDLPKGFPMYCKDLKQVLDEKTMQINGFADTATLENKLRRVKMDKDYPKQTNEHNSLADAKWNYELYKFLNSI